MHTGVNWGGRSWGDSSSTHLCRKCCKWYDWHRQSRGCYDGGCFVWPWSKVKRWQKGQPCRKTEFQKMFVPKIHRGPRITHSKIIIHLRIMCQIRRRKPAKASRIISRSCRKDVFYLINIRWMKRDHKLTAYMEDLYAGLTHPKQKQRPSRLSPHSFPPPRFWFLWENYSNDNDTSRHHKSQN